MGVGLSIGSQTARLSHKTPFNHRVKKMQPCLPLEAVPRSQWLYGVLRLNIGKYYVIIFSFQSPGKARQLHL